MPEITFQEDCTLTDSQRVEAEQLIREAADLLAPQLLRVAVGSCAFPQEDGGTAVAFCSPGQAGRAADIELSKAWGRLPPEHRRTVIFHEILHVTLYGPCYVFHAVLQHVPEDLAQTAEVLFRETVEGVIEDLTEALL